jgi:hypothetical protein
METSLERRPAGWPSDRPVWTLSVFSLAALVVPGRIAVEYAEHWSDLGAPTSPRIQRMHTMPAARYSSKC